MRIDGMAIKGYDYAVHGFKIPEFKTDMDLMAFNAGISNANIRHNLNVPQITNISKQVYHQRVDRESDKTLGIICNH